MKPEPIKHLEMHRATGGPIPSDKSFGNNGAFMLSYNGATLVIILSDGGGWDHVSVHVVAPDLSLRCPTWDEMEYVRKMVFRGDEWAMQLHAPVDKHINEHLHVLHIWRPQNQEIPVPPRIMV